MGCVGRGRMQQPGHRALTPGPRRSSAGSCAACWEGARGCQRVTGAEMGMRRAVAQASRAGCIHAKHIFV